MEDAVQANLLSATTTNMSSLNHVYNVAVGDRTTLNQLFYKLRESLSKRYLTNEEYASISAAQPIYIDFRTGDIKHSHGNIKKALINLNYIPGYTLNSGIEKLINK